MKEIRGVNLGNWLVLEKWMQIHMFDDTDAEDETWMNRLMDKEALQKKMKEHRETYVTEKDFEIIKKHGVNLVRIPVPYFIFGDRPPFIGCIEYLDRAFDWAEKYELEVLIDLHTVPGGQNGYDNGGLCGVCKWYKDKKEVEFVLRLLERLAKRYVDRKALFGIEIVNEPISFPVWMTSTAPYRYPARDKEEAKGSWFVPMKFLKPFYKEAYQRLRKIMPEEKAIVFHDGFRLMYWNRFFDENKMKNVYLDTHIYIVAMEIFVPIHKMWAYKIYVKFNKWKIKRVSKHIPVIVGEWCICNRYANDCRKKKGTSESQVQEVKRRFREVAKLQMDAWSVSAGFIYWNYQLWRDRKAEMDKVEKEPWDLSRCWNYDWIMQDFKNMK